MKPTFALDLTREAIALLHRTPKGWLPIGEVAFDAPDLAERLDDLRKAALGLSPTGLSCKLILPNSQILYTELHAPGPSREEKRRQIAAALEGRTPYAVEDLAFDWSGKGQTVKVAVVARETLEEAEAFAVTHGLNPVSFVAIPDGGEFVGEPWFGPSAAAEALLPPGESVDRDRDPVVILPRNPSTTGAAASPAEVDAEPALTPEAAAALQAAISAAAADDAGHDSLPGLDAALNGDLPLPARPAEGAAADLPGIDDGADDVDEDPLAAVLTDPPSASVAPIAAEAAVAEELAPQQAPDAAEGLAIAPETPAEAPVDAAPATADAVAMDREPALAASGLVDTAPAPAPAEVEEAPFAHVTDPSAFPDEDGPISPASAAPVGSAAALADDELPPAPPSAALVAFASRRTGATQAGARPLEGALRPGAAPSDPTPQTTGEARAPSTMAPVGPAAAATPAGRIARPAVTARSLSGPVTAPTIPGTRPRPKGKMPLGDIGATGTAGSGPRRGTTTTTARPAGTS